MSTSGPLLPTTAQEDPGGNPHSSAEGGSQEALVPSPSSASASPHLSPVKSAQNVEPSVTTVCAEETYEKKDEVLPLDDSNNTGKNDISGEDAAAATSNAAPSESHHLINEGSKPFCGPGKGALYSAREWSACSSNYGWEKAHPPSDIYLDGGGDALASVEYSPEYGSTPPAAERWAGSLRELLSDKEGCELFEIFLSQDKSKLPLKMLKFWYACTGLRKGIAGSAEDTLELINLIWNKFIENDLIKVSRETKAAIRDRIKLKNTDTSIFDQAQLEVEALMSETSYRRFLKSKLYISHYIGNKDGSDSQTSPTFGTTDLLPTLHEDAEYDQMLSHSKTHISVRPKFPSRLTTDNLLASARYRANIEKTRPEEFAGLFLRGDSYYGQNPYHAGYISGHAVSLQDSEIQSLSSGARTDDTRSCTDSSVDGFPLNSKFYYRKHQRKIRENAIQNKEEPYVLPRTMKNHQSYTPIATTNPEEFVKLLCSKLERVIDDTKKNEKIQHTMWKLSHGEDDPDEIRREYAVSSLPPNVLVNKLHEKVLGDEFDQCLSDQSILDNHIRKWDPTACSPGSPKYAVHSPPLKGQRVSCIKQLPHLSLPHSSVAPSTVGPYLPKYGSKGARHHASIHGVQPYCQSVTGYSSVPQSNVGTPIAPKPFYPPGQNTVACHLPHCYQPRSNYHGRRRDRGQDVHSTFSSDSGNVADYHDGSERIPPVHLPKSKSMPEYMENNTVGTVSDGGSSGGRRQGSGNRRSSRRPPADLTDSGVSVVSDSGRSVAPSSSSERVETWLLQSRPFTAGCPSHSGVPVSEKDFNESHKVRGTRSTTHTVAGFFSPCTQRPSEGSTGRRSQCSSSTSAVTCVMSAQPVTQDIPYQPLELSRDSPLGQSQQYISYEKRKNRGGNGSSSSKSTGQGSTHGDGTGSDGSTLKKQQKLPKCDNGAVSCCYTSTSQTTGVTSSCGAPPQTTTIIYNFSDDDVPFMVKLQIRPVTLKRFKENLPKKGSFRFYFKKVCSEVGVVFEEITDDSEPLPLFEGKVFSLIHKDESREEI